MSHALRVLAITLMVASGSLRAAPPVTAIAYLDQSKLIAVGTRGQVTLHDLNSYAVVETLGGQDERVTCIVEDPWGRLLVASGVPGKSGVLREYKPGKNTVEHILQGHGDIQYAMACGDLYGQRLLAVGGYDRVLKFWSLYKSPPKIYAESKDHSDVIHAAAFTKRGNLLATGSSDRTVKVWEMLTGKRLFTLSEPTDWVYAVAWHPDGKRLYAAGADKTLRVWDVTKEGGKLAASVFAHEAAVKFILLDSAGKVLLTVGEDRVVKSWDPTTLKERFTFPTQPETITAASLRADGKQLALGLFDGRTLFLDAETGKPVPTAKAKDPKITDVSPNGFRRGGKFTFVIAGNDLDEIQRLEAADGKLEFKLDPADAANPTKRRVHVRVSEQATIGPAMVTPIGRRGSLPAMRLWVDRYNSISEGSATFNMPATVFGTLGTRGEEDIVRFEAKAGDEVGASLLTSIERTKFDPVLTMTGPDGRTVGERSGYTLGLVIPKDGLYALAVRDAEYRGGADFGYRLNVGPIPIVSSVFPLGVTTGVPTEVRLRGVNLGEAFGRPISVTLTKETERGVARLWDLPPIDLVPQLPTLSVGEFPSVIHGGGELKLTDLPRTVDGFLEKPGEAQLVRFPAKKGHRLILDVEAARLGSPLDSMLEILDAGGKPLPVAVLRATAKAYTTFRDNDSTGAGIRLETWNEFGIDDYFLVGTQVLRLAELPKGPDDDCRFTAVEGKRLAYFGTTPQQIANGSAIYKVERLPPGSTFPPNGLPSTTLFARNDDGGPLHGKDSYLVFDPPADGEYVASIRDAAGAGGIDRAYRLTIREPRPDFQLRASTTTPKVWKNGGVTVNLTATRNDEFQGPIRIRAVNVPASFRIPDVVVEAEQTTIAAPIHHVGSASVQQASGPFEWVAEAEINGNLVTKRIAGGTIGMNENPDLTTSVAIPSLTITPGTETKLKVAIERKNDFTGRVPLDVRGLPHGVRVMNIGLSGILVVPGQTEREIVLYAEPWVKPMTVPVTILSRSERKGSEHAAPVVMLTVSPVSNAATPKP